MTDKRTKWRPRVTLVNLLLLVAALATAMASYRTKHQLARVKQSVTSMRSLARELRVEDRTKIAAIELIPTRPGERIFDVYIPETLRAAHSHRLAEQTANGILLWIAPGQGSQGDIVVGPGTSVVGENPPAAP